MKTSLLSKNEWDTLKSVVVGDATNARIPHLDKSLRTVNYADKADDSSVRTGVYPNTVIQEANHDLEIFTDFLINQGVEVLRPIPNTEPNYYNYCPRDGVLVYDDVIISTPQPLRARKGEETFIEHHFENLPAKYIKTNPSLSDDLYNENCIGDPDTLALTEIEPCFDAANVLRSNDDLFYLVSNSGNKAGADYLQELIGSEKTVWTIEGVYSYMHLDSTIALLRDGLMLLNPDRIKSKDQLPKPLQSWDAIWCPEPVDIGYYPGYNNASKWISMNLFSINPRLVVLEERQHSLRKELEKYNIECAMLPMRHARTLSGCFHCVTLDIEREE
jgi:N-dimethylarginine dimethylaminohydrolase